MYLSVSCVCVIFSLCITYLPLISGTGQKKNRPLQHLVISFGGRLKLYEHLYRAQYTACGVSIYCPRTTFSLCVVRTNLEVEFGWRRRWWFCLPMAGVIRMPPGRRSREMLYCGEMFQDKAVVTWDIRPKNRVQLFKKWYILMFFFVPQKTCMNVFPWKHVLGAVPDRML